MLYVCWCRPLDKIKAGENCSRVMSENGSVCASVRKCVYIFEYGVVMNGPGLCEYVRTRHTKSFFLTFEFVIRLEQEVIGCE